MKKIKYYFKNVIYFVKDLKIDILFIKVKNSIIQSFKNIKIPATFEYNLIKNTKSTLILIKDNAVQFYKNTRDPSKKEYQFIQLVKSNFIEICKNIKTTAALYYKNANKPGTKQYDEIYSFKKQIYMKTKFKKDRYHLFSYISHGLRNGATIVELLDSIEQDFRKNGQIILADLIEKTVYRMEEYGEEDATAMFNVGMINEIELKSIQAISQAEPYRAMEFINSQKKNENNFKWALGMLFFPGLLVTFGYIIFQPELKELTHTLLEPINQLSKKEIEIPAYFESRWLFIKVFMGMIITMFSLFSIVEYLKVNNPKLLFKIFRIQEAEFVVNNFQILLSLLKAGHSKMRAVEIIAESGDIVTRKIFTEIKNEIKDGENNIYDIISKYGINSGTVSYMRSGERNNTLIESVESIVLYNTERYEKIVKFSTKVFPLVGEIIMTMILLKPIIDIITVTTVGTLSFEV